MTGTKDKKKILILPLESPGMQWRMPGLSLYDCQRNLKMVFHNARLCCSQSCVQPFQSISYISVNANRTLLDFWRAIRLGKINTDIYGFWILAGHFPKGIFYDNRGVAANAQF